MNIRLKASPEPMDGCEKFVNNFVEYIFLKLRILLGESGQFSCLDESGSKESSSRHVWLGRSRFDFSPL